MAKESMKDMEKQVTKNSMDALPPVQVMAGGKEQDPLILVDRRINPVEGGGGGIVSAKMNLSLKNWRVPYWLIAGCVMVMTNHIHAAPKFIPAELAMFALFLCGTGLMFLAMKKMM
ncbi:uncharacterized protein [Miscanthus floridulus]|uniref:uncharacterized protein isoform X2 n=1 Tax=Miscanthus floridulus TaxID=154761 RepID=UPI003459F164